MNASTRQGTTYSNVEETWSQVWFEWGKSRPQYLNRSIVYWPIRSRGILARVDWNMAKDILLNVHNITLYGERGAGNEWM